VTVKKIAWILIAAAMIAVVVAPGVALANMGPHGGYIENTEACAGCHRAHTAPSSITWVDTTGAAKSALLLSDSSQVYLFCLTCHDSTSQGADTNVLDGVYEGTANGTSGADLISGAFGREDRVGGVPGVFDGHNNPVTSTHTMNGQSWGAWGGGAFGSTSTVDATGNYPTLLGTGNKIVMDCGTCHDPHGSSNYRILKDVVNGVAVGGYSGSAADPDPTPFVVSNETGYPVGGFRLHLSYNAGYVANYTTPQYAKAPGGDTSKGMVGWCVGCHTTYAEKTTTYNAGDGFGFVDRHKHPMNVPLSNFKGPRALSIASLTLPLAHDIGASHPLVNSSSDWIDCLTCHNAHGASTIMTGYANVADPVNDLRPDTGLSGGVPPTNDSALLKMNNRGVCEACHNK
jgi:predicted CXXCH cytochrome family protein